MVVVLFGWCAIGGDLLVEDAKAGIELGEIGPDPVAMHLQDPATLALGSGPLGPQPGIAQHLADRHAGRPEMADEADPDQDALVIVAPPAPPARGIGQEADPLVVADGMHAQPTGFCQVTDPHRLPSTSWTT